MDWIDFYVGCSAFKWEIRPIIYVHPEAIVGKLRKLLDCEDVIRNMRAVVAHLAVKWQVFDIWVISIYYSQYKDL